MRRSRPRFLLVLAILSLFAPGADAEQVCTGKDRIVDGTVELGETVGCAPATSGRWSCPLQARACTAVADGSYQCPFGAEYACDIFGGDPVPRCSPRPCSDSGSSPVTPPVTDPPPDPPIVEPPPSTPPDPPIAVDEPVIDDPGAPANGAIDADGNCLGTIEIFAGRALRCRPAGAQTSLSDCCKDKGEIIRDGIGSSASSVATKLAVASGVFTGMKAAYAAYQAGATASAAASAGANAIIVGLDPTSIAISLAINFMIEVLLQGCDQQDMETGMLRGSGMCHEVGIYCASSILGVCIQEAKSHCCFNTKLGRILQEQGRPQLKSFATIGWGPVKHPLCRGFTPEEFQALDFSKIDLSEYYSEIETRSQTLIQIDMQSHIDTYLREIVK